MKDSIAYVLNDPLVNRVLALGVILVAIGFVVGWLWRRREAGATLLAVSRPIWVRLLSWVWLGLACAPVVACLLGRPSWRALEGLGGLAIAGLLARWRFTEAGIMCPFQLPMLLRWDEIESYGWTDPEYWLEPALTVHTRRSHNPIRRTRVPLSQKDAVDALLRQHLEARR
jgi:hypothetical protein